MRNLSTLVEILNRGQIYEICKSSIMSNTWIIIFDNGSQANIDGETYNNLTTI